METGSAHSERVVVFLQERNLAITSRKEEMKKIKRDLKVGDIVILQEANTVRNDWQICRVMQTYYDDKGFVQSIRLKIGNVEPAGSNNIVDRPVSKVVLLLESKENVEENVLEFPPRKPSIKCNMILRYHIS